MTDRGSDAVDSPARGTQRWWSSLSGHEQLEEIAKVKAWPWHTEGKDYVGAEALAACYAHATAERENKELREKKETAESQFEEAFKRLEAAEKAMEPALEVIAALLLSARGELAPTILANLHEAHDGLLTALRGIEGGGDDI